MPLGGVMVDDMRWTSPRVCSVGWPRVGCVWKSTGKNVFPNKSAMRSRHAYPSWPSSEPRWVGVGGGRRDAA
eukprot:9241-Eustigmatos_ZCMA.PRE.1